MFLYGEKRFYFFAVLFFRLKNQNYQESQKIANNNVFISYRRDGGESLAQLLYTRLTNDGYKTFLDVESLSVGKFNEALF